MLGFLYGNFFYRFFLWLFWGEPSNQRGWGIPKKHTDNLVRFGYGVEKILVGQKIFQDFYLHIKLIISFVFESCCTLKAIHLLLPNFLPWKKESHSFS